VAPSRQATFVSLIADEHVARARLFFGSGGTRDIHLKRLGPHRAKIAGVEPLRYAAFAMAGATCVKGVTTFDRAGAVLDRSAGAACHRHPAPAPEPEPTESRPSVSLGAGRLGPYEWRSEVRSAGKLEDKEPGSVCLRSVLFEPGEGMEFEVCGPIPKGDVELSRGGKPRKPITVLAAVFPSPATTVYIKRAGEPGQSYKVHQFNTAALGASPGVELGGFARAYGGYFCLERYAAFDAEGAKVFDSGRRRCREPAR
jgi:hypothetical protein